MVLSRIDEEFTQTKKKWQIIQYRNEQKSLKISNKLINVCKRVNFTRNQGNKNYN